MYTLDGRYLTQRLHQLYDVEHATTVYCCLRNALPLELQDYIVSESCTLNFTDEAGRRQGFWRIGAYNWENIAEAEGGAEGDAGAGDAGADAVYIIDDDWPVAPNVRHVAHESRNEYYHLDSMWPTVHPWNYVSDTIRVEYYIDNMVQGTSYGYRLDGTLEVERMWVNGEIREYIIFDRAGNVDEWVIYGDRRFRWESGVLVYASTPSGEYWWHSNGVLQQARTIEVLHDRSYRRCRRWSETGILCWETRQTNDYSFDTNGEQRFWYTSGSLHYVYYYHDNKLREKLEWYESGILKLHHEHQNGKLTRTRGWYASDRQKYEYYYATGDNPGTYYRHGTCKVWSRRGKEIITNVYDKGRLISRSTERIQRTEHIES